MRYGGRIYACVIFLSVFFLQGCAVFMAARQPDRRDVSLFKVGTSRDSLLAEFGKPLVSEEKDGKKYEIFSFVQGYGTGTKVGRALFHGTADVFSLGLWEVIGTPTEAVFDGTKMSYKVSYDADDRVDNVSVLTINKQAAKKKREEENKEIQPVSPSK